MWNDKDGNPSLWRLAYAVALLAAIIGGVVAFEIPIRPMPDSQAAAR